MTKSKLRKKYDFIDLTSNESNVMNRFSTGSVLLDLHIGGGWPKGRIIEIYGPEASGKSTMALHACAEIQKEGKEVVYIDMEHALDPSYAEALGVDISGDKFLFAQPDSAEDALDLIQLASTESEVGLIVLDSVAALVPRAELEGQAGDAMVGLVARFMSQSMRKVNGNLLKSDTTAIFINQLRDKIGVIYGSPETTTGGNALKFYASIRVDMRRVKINKDKDSIAMSNDVKCKVVKNKTFPPFREPILRIVYGKGFDNEQALLQAAISAGVIQVARGMYSMDEVKLAYGEPKMLAMIEGDFRESLIEKIKANV